MHTIELSWLSYQQLLGGSTSDVGERVSLFRFVASPPPPNPIE